jgi:invasion protein IalB
MRLLPVFASLMLLAPAAWGQGANRAAAPRPAMIGEFQSWTAASHQENGQKVCYAFTRARNMDGVPGRDANQVMLLVTHRTSGRDQVAVRVGFSFARGVEGRLIVATGDFPMQASADTSFARDGRAVVTALRAGREALHRAPGPNGRGTATDTFALAGFTQAYDAITRECPVPARR